MLREQNVSEGALKVIKAVLSSQLDLQDTPHALFMRGELGDAVDAAGLVDMHEGARVEVIGGEVVVSPAPALDHGAIVEDVSEAFVRARQTDVEHEWRCQQGVSLDMVSLGEDFGFIPDLVVGESATIKAARHAQVTSLISDEVELVMEVTSWGNIRRERPPVDGRATKWAAYARAEIPYYLLIDRDPKAARVVLYTIPDAATGAYLDEQTWAFGEAVVLPDPFGLKIPTDEWRTWA
ncbi:Uma2 family endonuclease [Actinocorallia aurantiaca]|uniref:Uma2 family endonuclease n=1 Tax=Actinocorallia aurantiaca TaxID=46204 RepID=A0ABN3TT69_9ACTN